VARKLRINNSSDTSGTPGYMAPEVLCRQNHTYAADFFAVGVIAY
jgi:serine/threonine protein kinase